MPDNKTKRILVPGDDLNHEAIGNAIALGVELSKKMLVKSMGLLSLFRQKLKSGTPV